jgi:hypothetical protein
MPPVERIPFDLRVFGFTFLISVLCGLIFGLIPALQASRTNLLDTLKDGRSGKSAGGGFKGRFRGGNLIVIFEVALALLLLSGAGVMIKSFIRLTGIDPGFDMERLLTARISFLGNKKYASEEARIKRVLSAPSLDLSHAIPADPFRRHARSPKGHEITITFGEVPPRVTKLLKRRKGRCQECGLFFTREDVMEVDHILPAERQR